ncbi:hypothetical protein [Caloramator proteoclasticus]|uniref:Uncharacterized protein n=1 Tax=Caloramator proteoclasticus DSM 10124 TaxID=1121262 RepID=A0A1M4ZGL9_9CLOT|nr:hypothetical protein [Caloramator proteoclasticus]SHF17190.1 hypothetical protein SAMN02746091_01922 [Caloramator proteoclasticus DSM 10124]
MGNDVLKILKGGYMTIGEVRTKLQKANEDELRQAIIDFIIEKMREER